MGKRIWIVNYYTSSNCSNPRYIELAKHFGNAGFTVVTFNSNVAEGLDMQDEFEEKVYGSNEFVHVKVPSYVSNGIKRIFSIWSFAWKLYRKCDRFERPDIVLHNLHTPFDYPIMWMAKKLSAKYIAETWDMWPENFVTFGLLSPRNPLMKLAYAAEKRIYQNADQVIFTQEGGPDYIRNKRWSTDKGGPVNMDKVHYINSGVNVELFDKDVENYPRPDDDLNFPNTFKIIYLGAIRLVNNVKTLIDAAVILKDNPKYRFFIYGDGTDRKMLEQYVADNHIDNVIFKEKRVSLSEVAWIVSQATVNIMNYQKNFGIHGVSSGKMFQYFAAGKPICCNIKLNYSEISRRNLGIDRELDTPEQYAQAIRQLAEQPEDEYRSMCDRVRKAGEDFDYAKLAAREIDVVERCL